MGDEPEGRPADAGRAESPLLSIPEVKTSVEEGRNSIEVGG